MLPSVGFIITFLLTSLVVSYTYKYRKRFNPMIAMLVSMANSMMTSIVVGTILGIILPDKDLTLPTIIAVSIGMGVGYITGRPVSGIASLEGITAGVMGGMMGAMLGVMVPPNHTEVMVYFIVVVYLMVNIMVFRVMSENIQSSKFVDSLLTVILILVSMGFLVYLNFHFL